MTSWIRLVLAISLDGRISPPLGGPAHLGGKGDRRVLEESLAWADGTLMGSKTLQAHQSTCLIKTPELTKKRLLEGRSAQPISIIVSRLKKHSLEWPFFKQPLKRWLLSPPAYGKDAENNQQSITGYDCQIALKSQWQDTLLELTKKGLHKLVILGGAELVGSLLEADVIDELQLTITPKILGGENTWVPIETTNLHGEVTNQTRWLLKESNSLESNEFMLRYFRNRSNSLQSSLKTCNPYLINSFENK